MAGGLDKAEHLGPSEPDLCVLYIPGSSCRIKGRAWCGLGACGQSALREGGPRSSPALCLLSKSQ